jgi:hypothetical protein
VVRFRSSPALAIRFDAQFGPTNGIERCDDPLIDTRDGANAVSSRRRNPRLCEEDLE